MANIWIETAHRHKHIKQPNVVYEKMCEQRSV